MLEAQLERERQLANLEAQEKSNLREEAKRLQAHYHTAKGAQAEEEA